MKISNITGAIMKLGTVITKHSPIIFTAVGVVGVGATSVLAYKAKDKVSDIVEHIESSNNDAALLLELEAQLKDTENRMTDEQYLMTTETIETLSVTHVPYSRMDIAKDVASAIALPVFTGILSISAIILSYQIQNNRIGSLAAALATSATEQAVFRKRYEKKHGEDEYVDFMSTDVKEVTVTDSKGKEKQQEEKVRNMADSLTQYWYDQSSEYVSDDHDYNMAFINARLVDLDMKLFTRGVLSLNQVLIALGLQPTKAGASVGWSSNSFNIEPRIVNTFNELSGEHEKNILITMSQPTFIYDNEDYVSIV